MADLETPADGDRALDPDAVSERSFPTAFRGFDPVQVRSFLGTVADELRRLRAVEAELRAAVEAASAVEGPEAKAEAEAAVAPEAAAPDDVVEEAKAEADRLVREARERVATLGSAATAEATRVLDEARAEAARLRATATDDLKGRVEEAEASAVRKIAEAEREAAAIRVKAREEADATIEAARERGREMVAEAQAARERMLADLAKRKRSAQAQLEALRAGRDRLLDTLKVARRSIDEMTGRFDTDVVGGSAGPPPSSGVPSGQVTTTPGLASTEARPRPASRAASASASPDAGEAETVRPAVRAPRSVIIGEGPPSAAPRPSIAAAQAAPPPPSPEPAPEPAAPTAAASDEVVPEPPPHQERRSSALRILRRNKGGDQAPAVPALIGRESSVEGVRIIGREPEPEPEPEPVREQVPEPVRSQVPEPARQPVVDEVPEVASDDEAQGTDVLDSLLASEPPLPEEPTAPEPEPEADELLAEVDVSVEDAPPLQPEAPPLEDDAGPPPEPLAREEIRPRIEDLFARIRADREAATASARQVLASVESDESPVEEERIAASATAATPTSDADEQLLQQRDAITEPLAGQLTKRLKRALQDEQNASLDRLRTSRGTVGVDQLLSRVDDQRAPYRLVANPFLERAARGGAAASEFGAVAVAVAVDDLAGQLAEDLAGALRSRLDTVLGAAASEGLDLSGIGERISSVYREWKVQKIERLALHYLVAAHERGGFLARPEGTPLRWLVDDEGPCPDCEDNALAGPTPRGEAFPTGQLHPPAHVGCRCLLAPAPH
jgi:DivIVA domain-containing protein